MSSFQLVVVMGDRFGDLQISDFPIWAGSGAQADREMRRREDRGMGGSIVWGDMAAAPLGLTRGALLGSFPASSSSVGRGLRIQRAHI